MIGRRETSCAYVGGGCQTLFIIDAVGVHHKGEYYLCQHLSTGDSSSTKEQTNEKENTTRDKANNDLEKLSSYDVVGRIAHTQTSFIIMTHE